MKTITRWRLPQRILIFLLLILSACQAPPESQSRTDIQSPKVQSQREYLVRQTLTLKNQGPSQPEKQNLWVALIRDIPPYQKLVTRNISPSQYELVTDEYGNEYAEFDFSGQSEGTEIQVQIEYEVIIFELTYDLEICKGSLPEEFTQPELHIESANPQIIAISEDLSRDTQNACEQIRAFYDYVGDELVYTYNHNDWGAQATLGPMGADCTEFSSLMMGLSRAAGIPARYFEGLLYLDEETGGLAQTEHAWLDVYLPGIGWTAMDPTLGRSPISEEMYFAHYTPQHIIVTLGRNPSTLRGASYWSHLYWPGNSTEIRVYADWQIIPLE